MVDLKRITPRVTCVGGLAKQIQSLGPGLIGRPSRQPFDQQRERKRLFRIAYKLFRAVRLHVLIPSSGHLAATRCSTARSSMLSRCLSRFQVRCHS